ncbi:Hypothetical predicted protein [Xyrichtys novacula]|uniref:Uncharacterized protein n=1 Tax=Xyrichtys novacula TaxID=13765 RepID=A0AAV1G2S1_XYRNO|nr:Hypothetical predicted protein [Xyrichtys novacula]
MSPPNVSGLSTQDAKKSGSFPRESAPLTGSSETSGIISPLTGLESGGFRRLFTLKAEAQNTSITERRRTSEKERETAVISARNQSLDLSIDIRLRGFTRAGSGDYSRWVSFPAALQTCLTGSHERRGAAA